MAVNIKIKKNNLKRCLELSSLNSIYSEGESQLHVEH